MSWVVLAGVVGVWTLCGLVYLSDRKRAERDAALVRSLTDIADGTAKTHREIASCVSYLSSIARRIG